jgi:transcriptional regulator with XRE-family HTH domain
MFDVMEIGRRISRLRKEKDMTQPALADKMGVSFQAVSNWERGASMPDIGKLPELAEILGVSVDELLGGGRGSELVTHVLDGSEESFVEEADVTLEEAGEAAPVLKPKQVKRIVLAINEKREKKHGWKKAEKDDGVSLSGLLAIAPFLDEETVDDLAMRLAPVTGIAKLAAIAPFVSEKTLDQLAERAVAENVPVGEIASIAPFLSEKALDKLAERALDGKSRVGELASIAPFLSEKTLGNIAQKVLENGGRIGELASIAPFLEEDQLDKIVKSALESGVSSGEMAVLFPFLSQETLKELVKCALSKDDSSSIASVMKFIK